MKVHAPYHEPCDSWHEPGDCDRDDTTYGAWVAAVVEDTPDSRCELCGMLARTVAGRCSRCDLNENDKTCQNCGLPISGGSVCSGCANEWRYGGI